MNTVMYSANGELDTLPLHQPYDSLIELLLGAEISFGQIFPLSEQEQEALKKFVDENLEKGSIYPSTSPAVAGIFSLQKKDYSLL